MATYYTPGITRTGGYYTYTQPQTITFNPGNQVALLQARIAELERRLQYKEKIIRHLTAKLKAIRAWTKANGAVEIVSAETGEVFTDNPVHVVRALLIAINDKD